MGVAIALGVAGIASSVGSAIAQGNAAKRAAESQKKAAEKSGEAGEAFTNRQLGILSDLSSDQKDAISRFSNSFIRTGNATEFIKDAIDINRKGFNFQDEIKKQNLDFVLGESKDNLRTAQGDFTNLAAGNFSGFERELNASLSKAGAESFGSPVGTVFNIAARDRFNFRTAGLNEALKIGDFFSAQGTVDPPNPVASAFALADFEQRENARAQELNQFLLGSELSVSGTNFDRGTNISKIGLLSETNSLNAIGQLGGVNQAAQASQLAGLAQGFSSASSLVSNQQQNKQDQANFQSFLQALGMNRQANTVGT